MKREIKERTILDKYQIRTSKKLPLTGLDLYSSSIEMNIAFKEEPPTSEKRLRL